MIKKLIPIFGFVAIVAIFFWQFLLKGMLPIPSDTIVGLYYPYRDNFASTNPSGLPYKNFLITDPVRQQYPWRSLSFVDFKGGSLPTWNSYSFSGTPNLANFQSAAFYPFNFVFLLLPFDISWSILILIQPLLGGIFLYLYLRNLKLDEYSSFFGGIIFSFSGFFVTWLEWGTVVQSALWLPLILLSIDNLFDQRIHKYIFAWSLILIFSICSSFFAGHLQTFFYIFIFSFIYSICRIWQSKKRIKFILPLFVSSVLSLVIVLPQLLPTLQFILVSARVADQALWQKEGWFVPYQHLIQFLIPDFFGNPATLNYWGVWNYGELTAYIGITGIMLAFFAILFRRDKKTLFFASAFLVGLILALPNFISKLPFELNLEFISTAQPTRLLFIVDFSLSVLAALGLNYFIHKGRFRQIMIPVLIIGSIFIISFIATRFGIPNISTDNLSVSQRNMYFPGAIFAISCFNLIFYTLTKKKFKKYFIFLLIFLAIVDLLRFSWKFNTFSKSEYLYPQSAAIEFVQNNIDDYRIATTDPRILPPNFSIMHNLQSTEGYDPLYLERYGEFIAAINRNKPNINPPFGFNRIVRITNFNSNLVDLLGVKFVFSLSEVNDPGFTKVFEKGETKIYQNDEILPKAFFVKNVIIANSKEDAIEKMFDKDFIPFDQAIVEEKVKTNYSLGNARLSRHSNNIVEIETENESEGFLVLTDTYYPTWNVKINGKPTKIYRTDFNFRGVIVPKGKNIVEFNNSLL